ncbi:MAG: hypothetical protein KBH81_02380 [Phycisphaerae bacterium]|jgi:hypothetical protein|nr:hypothetical protein [Phycisphaerae bacterium]HPC22118.1 hypothetical protein [Phycisphaerae bacterium]HRS27375.1 hypothetical protein [Phycisphaerae bacterium]
MRKQRALVALAIVFLPGVMLAPLWRLGGLGAGEDDLLYYFPSRSFFHDTVRAGQWPWINPWTGLDRPFAADPQSALWYPGTWLFALLPPLPAYAVSLWAHYSLAIWGMYRLLRAGRLARPAALFGGLLFAFSGFMLAHRAHFSLQHAAAWAPWVFWRIQRYAQNGGGFRLTTASIVAALQLYAGHVQIAAITALGSLVFIVAAGWAAAPKFTVKLRAAVPAFGRWLGIWVLAGGLFAVQLVPTVMWLEQCTRVDRTYRDFVENSWYPWSAIGWVAPMFFGQRTPNFFDQPYWGPSHQCEQFAYAGIVPLILAAVALRVGWRGDPQRRPWMVLLIFGVLVALGQFGPLCPLLYQIPGSSLFRVPARALLLFNMSIAALAAISLHDLGAAHNPRRVRLRAALQAWSARPHIKGAALVGMPLIVGAAVIPFLPSDWRAAALHALRPWSPSVFVPLAVAMASFASLGVAARRWHRPRWLWLPVIVTTLDLAVIGWTIDIPLGKNGPADLLPQSEAPWVERVRDSGRRLWVVAHTADIYGEPLNILAANVNSLVGIQSLTDYGPLQPRSLQPRFAFRPWGESDQVRALLQDPRWMRTYNVGWILTRDPADEPAGCTLEEVDAAGWRLYRNPSAAGMAVLEDAAAPVAISSQVHSNQRFEVVVDSWLAGERHRPGRTEAGQMQEKRLIVSRLAQPGWQARIANRQVAIEPRDGLMSLRVPAGEYVKIDFSYSPPGLREGLLVSGATVIVILVLAAPGSRRTRQGQEATASSAVCTA